MAGELNSLRDVARAGDTERLRALLTLEGHAQASLNEGLGAAAEACHLPAVETLLAAGADPNARLIRGWTSLHLAASAAPSSPTTASVVGALLGAGAAPSARTDFGATPLHVAAEAASRDAIERNEGAAHYQSAALGVIEALLAGGADALEADVAGRTPRDEVHSHPNAKEVWRLLREWEARSPQAGRTQAAGAGPQPRGDTVRTGDLVVRFERQLDSPCLYAVFVEHGRLLGGVHPGAPTGIQLCPASSPGGYLSGEPCVESAGGVQWRLTFYVRRERHGPEAMYGWLREALLQLTALQFTITDEDDAPVGPLGGQPGDERESWPASDWSRALFAERGFGSLEDAQQWVRDHADVLLEVADIA